MSERELYAWVSVMADGKRTIVGIYSEEVGGHLPLVAHERDSIERFRYIAIAHGKQLHQPVELVKWSTCTVLERW